MDPTPRPRDYAMSTGWPLIAGGAGTDIRDCWYYEPPFYTRTSAGNVVPGLGYWV